MKAKEPMKKLFCRIAWLLVSLGSLIHISSAGTVFADRTDQKGQVDKEISAFLMTALGKDALFSKTNQTRPKASNHRLSFTQEGYLCHIGSSPGTHFPVTHVVVGNFRQTAQNFMKERAALFGVTNEFVDFTPLKSRVKHGRKFEKLGQTYMGLPIFGAQVLIQLNEIGGVEFVLSTIETDLTDLSSHKLSMNPAISAQGAKNIVRKLFFDKNATMNIDFSTPKLNLFSPRVLGLTGDIKLVWYLKAYSEDDIEAGKELLIDARTGSIIRQYPLSKESINRSMRDANFTESWGDIVRSEGEPSCGIRDADDAYDYAGDTYFFYKNYHDRDSYDGSGGEIKVTVRYCEEEGEHSICPYFSNAFFLNWRNRIYLGAGYAVDDVFAHEYTHAVTSEESELVYENDSGAINEAFSDIWGEFVDFINGDGWDTADYYWLIGEDLGTENGGAGGGITTVGDPEYYIDKGCEDKLDNDNDGVINDGCPERQLFGECDNLIDDNLNGVINEGCPETGSQCSSPGTDDDGDGYIDEGCPRSCHDGIDNGGDGSTDVADSSCYIRNMKNPPAKKDPDKLSSSYYRAYTLNPAAENDYGGVHRNNGIINKLAYLLTDGDTFNGQSIYGLGMERVADLFYEVQTMPLNSAANYWNLAVALRQAAINLGWHENDQENLYYALLAVEIYDTIFVDKEGAGLTQTGWIRWPFDTVVEAQNAVPERGIILAKPDTYAENMRLERKATYKVWGSGKVIIGR